MICIPSDWSTGSVSNRAYFRLSDVPIAVSGTVMTNYADDARMFLQNYTQSTISATAIDDPYKTILVDLTCVYTLQRMAQEGIGAGYSIGEFATNNNVDKRIETYQQRVDEGLKALGRPQQWGQTFI